MNAPQPETPAEVQVDLRALVSLSALRVASPRSVASQVAGVLGRRRDPALLLQLRAERAALVHASSLPFRIDHDLGARAPSRARPCCTSEQGGLLVSLYFHQVLGEGPVFLDLGPRAFRWSGAQATWSPSNLVACWSDSFRAACRDMYAGHYTGDAERFACGAKALGFGGVQGALKQQFGDTRAVHFTMRTFAQRSLQMLGACARAGATMHPEFLSLSYMLLTMYRQLDALDEPVDVRAAFERVEGCSTRCA